MTHRVFRAGLIAAALALPATAGHAGERAATSGEFSASFADLAPPASAPAVRDGAVDVATLSPTREDAGSAAADETETGLGHGVASYYADAFNGRRTASGERFSNGAMTAAHRTLPFGTRLRLTNPSTGASVVVRVNDRGPFHASRTLDVSKAAAQRLGLVARGSGTVRIARLD